jgi:hypothetical protein
MSIGRLRMTGYAAAQILLSVPALVLFVLNAVAGTLVVLVIGIPILMLTLPASRWLAGLHRRMAADILGSPVPAPYRPTAGAAPMDRLRIWASDPMTWRDEAWLLLALPLALTMSLLVVLLLVLVVTGVAWWYGVGPIMSARSRLDRALLTFGTTERLEGGRRGGRWPPPPPPATPSTTPRPSCAGSSVTSTTVPRHGWSASG